MKLYKILISALLKDGIHRKLTRDVCLLAIGIANPCAHNQPSAILCFAVTKKPGIPGFWLFAKLRKFARLLRIRNSTNKCRVS